MTITYTRKQRDAINAAYDAIAYLASCQNWSFPNELREALKYEHRRRSGVTNAKALLVSQFLQGMHTTMSPAELINYSNGCRTAHMLGAALAARVDDALLALLQAAREAHDAALAAVFDRIGSE